MRKKKMTTTSDDEYTNEIDGGDDFPMYIDIRHQAYTLNMYNSYLSVNQLVKIF